MCRFPLSEPFFGVEREVGFWFRVLLLFFLRTKPSKKVLRWFAKALLSLLVLCFVCVVKDGTIVQKLKATHSERMSVDIADEFFIHPINP